MGGWTDRGTGLQIPNTNLIVVPSSISILIDGEEVGYIERIDYTTSRNVDRIRHINMTDAGKIVEQVPFPEDMSITANGFALYNSSLIGRIAGAAKGRRDDSDFGLFHSLNSQVYPFDILITGTHPQDASKTWDVIHGQCMITNYSKPISLGDAEIRSSVSLQPKFTEAIAYGTTEGGPSGLNVIPAIDSI